MSDAQQLESVAFSELWESKELQCFFSYISYGFTNPMPETEEGPWMVTAANIFGGKIQYASSRHTSQEAFDRHLTKKSRPAIGDLLLTKDGTLGRMAIVDRSGVCINQSVAVLKPNGAVDTEFLKLLLEAPTYQQKMIDDAGGSTIKHIYISVVGKMLVATPRTRATQRKIARILTTLDNVITQTEALIAKYQAIKQGLMHDLFTRGVDATGKLRPPKSEAPELYKQSELGWIPKEWEVCKIGDFVDSLIDGPFGSNLKTEHYVDEPCVRVVRLQNISNSGYDDSEPAFITQSHANFLSRHKVVGGDVLIASLGDENHPPGRSCLYPSNLPPAVNKADCFRLRCNSVTAVNAFVSYALNTSCVRQETKRFTQGITLVRVNGTNLKKVSLKLPSVDEQQRIVQRLGSVNAIIATQNSIKEKYLLQKHGLMQDLLTGKVPVKADEPEEITP
jgi:type I restriction enzyme S subunit